MQEEAERCPLCGTSDWEWAANPHAYYPATKFCPGCHLTETARKDNHQDGAKVVLVPTDSPEYQAALDAEERRVLADREARKQAEKNKAQQTAQEAQALIEQL